MSRKMAFTSGRNCRMRKWHRRLHLQMMRFRLQRKRTAYLRQHLTAPYEVGDLWVQGTTGDIMRCIRTRLSGNYSSSDWQKASKYTDNTALNNFINGTYSDDIADLTTQMTARLKRGFRQPTRIIVGRWRSGQSTLAICGTIQVHRS